MLLLTPKNMQPITPLIIKHIPLNAYLVLLTLLLHVSLRLRPQAGRNRWNTGVIEMGKREGEG